MPIGPALRHRLGRLEQPAAQAYRAAFFNVDHFVDQILTAVPHASSILEIGCGDGDVATALTRVYAQAQYLGIDIAPSPGRRYYGEPAQASFQSTSSTELVALADVSEHEEMRFDLVVIADVLHHIPDDEARASVLGDAAHLLAPGGTLVVKEWEVTGTPAYWAGYAADRWISGDATVRYMPRAGLTRLFDMAAPQLRHEHTLTVRPWKCNVMHVFRKD